jgi:hypothetical protein
MELAEDHSQCWAQEVIVLDLPVPSVESLLVI